MIIMRQIICCDCSISVSKSKLKLRVIESNMLYSISCYYDIQAALGLAGLVVFEMIMIAQEVSTAKPPTCVENGKITKMGVGAKSTSEKR